MKWIDRIKKDFGKEGPIFQQMDSLVLKYCANCKLFIDDEISKAYCNTLCIPPHTGFKMKDPDMYFDNYNYWKGK